MSFNIPVFILSRLEQPTYL